MVVDLICSVSPRVVIEFGVNLGRTAKAILTACPDIETYIGVDVPREFRPRLACQHLEVPHDAALHVLADRRFWLLCCSQGSMTLRPSDLEPIDAAFIDGDHSLEGVSHDSRLARSLLRPGGIIVWHDYGNPAVEVTAALDRFVELGWPICHVEGTWLAYMRNPS